MLLAVLTVLLGAAPGGEGVNTPQVRRILYFTHSASYFHEILPYSAECMAKWAEKDGTYVVDQTDDCAVITPENMAKYACLVFYTNRELPISEDNRRAILDYVRNGGGFVAIHSGTGTFFEWPPYQEMINAIFDGHPWTQKVRVIIEDRKHPITKGLPEAFEVPDEIYQHTNWSREVTHVLASLDITSVDLNAKGVKRQDRDFGLAWAHRYGQGRVYVNALGHTKDCWDNLCFESMIVRGIRWAMKDYPLDLPEKAETGKQTR
jgi:hypothetical protein